MANKYIHAHIGFSLFIGGVLPDGNFCFRAKPRLLLETKIIIKDAESLKEISKNSGHNIFEPCNILVNSDSAQVHRIQVLSIKIFCASYLMNFPVF